MEYLNADCQNAVSKVRTHLQSSNQGSKGRVQEMPQMR